MTGETPRKCSDVPWHQLHPLIPGNYREVKEWMNRASARIATLEEEARLYREAWEAEDALHDQAFFDGPYCGSGYGFIPYWSARVRYNVTQAAIEKWREQAALKETK